VALAKSALVRSKPRDAKAAAALQTVLDNALLGQHKYLEERKRHQCQIIKMPFDLMAMIFEILVYEDHMSPIRISHVSSTWRDIIYDLPNLWFRLMLKGKPAKHEIKTKFWMNRSQGRIRDIYFDNFEYLEDCLNVMGDKTVAGLENIHFNFADPVPHHYRLKADPLAFSWICHTDYFATLRRLPFETKSNGFRITELELMNIMLLWSIEVEQLSNLTKLTVFRSNLTVGDLFKLLQKSPNMQTLQVQTNPSTMPSSSTRVTLPNLGTLELAVDPSILQFIEVPAVQVLQFEDIRLSTALQHLKPRTLPLTSFSAIGCSSLGDETLPLPDTLTALELSWPSFDVNAILEKLTEGQCPNITYLNLSCSNAHSSSIIRLVKARNGPTVSQGTSQDESQADETADFAADRYSNVRHLNLPRDTANHPSVIYQVTSWESGRQIKGCKEEYENSDDKKQEIEALKGGEQVKSQPARLHTLILDRCNDIAPESLPWLRYKVPIVRCVFESKLHIRKRPSVSKWPSK